MFLSYSISTEQELGCTESAAQHTAELPPRLPSRPRGSNSSTVPGQRVPTPTLSPHCGAATSSPPTQPPSSQLSLQPQLEPRCFKLPPRDLLLGSSFSQPRR